MTLQLQEFITAIEKITINDDKGNKLILSDELKLEDIVYKLLFFY